MAGKNTTTKTQKDGPFTGVFRLWAWILLFWSIYRYFFHFSEAVDELIFKPLIFIGPVLYSLRFIEKRPLSSLGFTTKNFFKSLYLGIGIGFIFAIEGLLANFIKYGRLTINPLQAFEQYGFFLIVLSFATAFSEELLARGYLFSRIYEKSKENLLYASFYSTAMFTALHVPILLTTLRYEGVTLILFFATGIAISFANAVLFRYTKSLVAPILVHLFWNMTLALYL